MEQRNHFFFAVKIPEETKLIMKDHLNQLKEKIPFSRWVHHQDLHITLAFLGAAADEKRIAAEKNVNEALKEAAALTLNINKLGFFGMENAPRVFWADTEESAELKNIREKVFSACVRAGFQLETRPFRPHITLARKWNGTTTFQKEWLEVWQELQPAPLPFQANEVVLYQTHLHQTPKYEVINQFNLQA
ncbi:RNA 2',3'-cyclic phosphodiesterase [Neobacillus vireti]|uniref:RNA 2',3'-cyclic phosphodiesterase n=1 Tax=Neobacillus vireti LMG 21834 TaxID=1131730 RepID=A0AB94IU02_9BACI|nr:RNA 2',3'-cyclic phosphodiesterase [Neobacillus vireti]ETI70448.1 2'-5' RNA ligase [Neobacillus vireti LMG 21834]KLT16251.1 2'-5' RNA ligase [Neobacillus vireti]